MAEQDTPPLTITAMKIPIIKKGEYDIWSMRMRQYICRSNNNLWDIIINGDLQEELAPTGDQSGPSAPPVPKTTKQLAAKRNQEREAIKSRFGGNEESKKMQKNVLKHQLKTLLLYPNEGLVWLMIRFQKLNKSIRWCYAAPVSKEDIQSKKISSEVIHLSLEFKCFNHEKNKPDIDQTDIDDLYNNLRVYEDEMKRSSSSTSNSQNLAFLSSENTSRTNEVSTASGNFGVNTAGGTNSSSQVSSTPGADEVVCSFFAQQTTSPPLDNEDLQQIDQDDLEELDIRWQVAMLTVRDGNQEEKTLVIMGKRNANFKMNHLSRALVAQAWSREGVQNSMGFNAKRVNHQKFSNKLNYPQERRTFVPSGVLTRTGLVNPVRPNEKRAVQTINTARPVSTAKSVSTARPFAPKTT
ncbi:hypothetical protein Tco_0679376 [Tanacetum coccineum]|uniref:Uncharacterized protein n=1 Tax=Tanacetum coccineum TaxID=301880 RepID=A0ABQ4XJ46_9ASTR